MMKNKILIPFKYLAMLGIALSLTFLTNCGDDDDVDTPVDEPVSEFNDIMQTLADLGEYDTLIYLLENYPIDANGTILSTLLSADGTYTLFAPNNAAFIALYATVGVSKAADVSPAIVAQLLAYHGAGSVVNEITPGASITTVQGEAIVVNLDNPDADGSEGSPEDGTLLTGSNTKGILVVGDLVQASNGVIWNVGTVLIPPTVGNLLASILGTNAASLLIGDTFSAMGAALRASEVFAVTNELPSLIDFLANPEVMSTVFAVPNPVFEAAGLSVETFSGEEWYGILSHHVVSEAGALKATDDASKVLDAATLTGGLFNDGKFVDGMLGVPNEEGGINYLPHYIKYDAALAGQFGGGTGVLIDSDLDYAYGMSADSAGFWNAEVLYPDAATNVNGVIHVIVGFLAPTKMEPAENPMTGTWTLAPIAGALAVGPATDDLGWWSNSAADVLTRDCHFDDQYVFDAGTMSTNDDGEEIWSGSYEILTDGSTWIETWQGVDAEGCGAPVAPHDESNAPFTYEVNTDNETVTLFGVGAYFGLAKATNEGELSADAPPAVPSSITYNYVGGDDEPDHHATFQVVYPGGVWQFILANADFEGEDGNGGGEPNGPTDVTFHLDFNTYLADTSKTETAPFLNGTFNGWCGDCNPMTDEDGDGIYTITIPLDSGVYEWKFTAGGWNDQEMFDAGTAGTIGDEFVNRLLTVLPTMMEMNEGPYCWNTFEPCPPPSASVTFRLNFSTYLADTSKTETAPFLNGTFNGWCGDCNPMTESTVAGVYTITIPLPAGDHELKFTAGGWNDQEMFDAGTEGTVGTEFVNRTITIVETDIDTDVDYGVYCWNQFVDCE
jgi:uncharacterized surface protein with fasciclin (FAS1) repeats